MKCPHCMENFHEEEQLIGLGKDAESFWAVAKTTCPACQRMIIMLENGVALYGGGGALMLNPVHGRRLVRPRASLRRQCPPEVPQGLAGDYNESCLVLPDSPKASAALSRRCLQHLLREEGGVKPGNLADEIQQVIDSGKLPSFLVESIDAVRNIGNFAAHPMKSQSSGEILDVEPGEAEWNLDVLESLFDFYFVQPEVLKKKRSALNDKLKGAGKPPMR